MPAGLGVAVRDRHLGRRDTEDAGWIAGTGVNSNALSRIMAPLSQSETFGAGAYISRGVLARVRDPAIHNPEEHGLRPTAYPAKIVPP